MLDTDALRLDVAAVVRVARSTETRRVRWARRFIEFDEEQEVLLFPEDDLEVNLVRIRVRVPSTGEWARGPVLAVCPRGCRRRARVLWCDPRSEFFPVCRSCARVEYASAHGTELERAELAHARLRDRLGLAKHSTHEPRPHQHRSTYRRDACRLEDARQRLIRARSRRDCRRRCEESLRAAIKYVLGGEH